MTHLIPDIPRKDKIPLIPHRAADPHLDLRPLHVVKAIVLGLDRGPVPAAGAAEGGAELPGAVGVEVVDRDGAFLEGDIEPVFEGVAGAGDAGLAGGEEGGGGDGGVFGCGGGAMDGWEGKGVG